MALPRIGSDHTPLSLDTWARKISTPKHFKFEKWQLSHPDFNKIVHHVCNTTSNASSSIENWQFKISLLRKKIKGWSINIEAANKKRKRKIPYGV